MKVSGRIDVMNNSTYLNMINLIQSKKEEHNSNIVEFDKIFIDSSELCSYLSAVQTAEYSSVNKHIGQLIIEHIIKFDYSTLHRTLVFNDLVSNFKSFKTDLVDLDRMLTIF